MCSGSRRQHNHEILSEIDVDDGKHHSTILDGQSNDVHAVDCLIEMLGLVDRVYIDGSLTKTLPQSKHDRHLTAHCL